MGPRRPTAFPRDARLVAQEQFRRVFAQPFRSTDSYFAVLARSGAPEQTHPRLGLALSRKCAKRAVDRNRLKRLVRESFRLWQSQLPVVDIVVTCRTAAVQRPNPDISASLAWHWERLIRHFDRSSSA